MKTKEELLQTLDAARAKIEVQLAEIDKQREIYPTWTVKEIIAHLTGWDEATAASLRAHMDNSLPGTPASRGVDEYNAQSVEERRALDYDQVVQEWRLARVQLKEAIDALTPEKWEQEMLFPWGQSGSIRGLLGVWIGHEEEHAEDLRKIVAGEDHHPHG